MLCILCSEISPPSKSRKSVCFASQCLSLVFLLLAPISLSICNGNFCQVGAKLSASVIAFTALYKNSLRFLISYPINRMYHSGLFKLPSWLLSMLVALHITIVNESVADSFSFELATDKLQACIVAYRWNKYWLKLKC